MLITILAVVIAGACIWYVLRLRVQASETVRRCARVDRAARKSADSRRNLRNRFSNALERAARENATRKIFVRKADFDSMFDVYVAHSNLDRSHDHLLTVRVLRSSGTGFEVIVDGVLWPWTRYCGPQEYFVDDLLPRLVNVTRAYVK